MATLLRPAFWRMWRTVWSTRSSALEAARSSMPPALVSSTARVWRRNSEVPTSSSSDWICRLTALCVSDSSSAAARKFRCRATASKARRCPMPMGRVRGWRGVRLMTD